MRREESSSPHQDSVPSPVQSNPGQSDAPMASPRQRLQAKLSSTAPVTTVSVPSSLQMNTLAPPPRGSPQPLNLGSTRNTVTTTVVPPAVQTRPAFPSHSPFGSFGVPDGGAEQPADTYFTPVGPARKRSVLMTNPHAGYKSVMEPFDGAAMSFAKADVDSFAAAGSMAATVDEADGDVAGTILPVSARRPVTNQSFIGFVRRTEDAAEIDSNDPMNAYQFVVGANTTSVVVDPDEEKASVTVDVDGAGSLDGLGAASSDYPLPNGSGGPLTNGSATASNPHAPYGDPNSGRTTPYTVDKTEQLNEIAQHLSRSFARSFARSGAPAPQRGREFLDSPRTTAIPVPFEDGGNNEIDKKEPSAVGGYPGSPECRQKSNMLDMYVEERDRLPMPMTEPCTSVDDLVDDTISLKATWESVRSDTAFSNLMFSLRCTIFALLPTFFLAEYEKTASWFAASTLLPIIATLFVRPGLSLGSQMLMTVMALQVAVVIIVWGVLMNAVGAKNNLSGWWCGVLFGSFGFSMLGDLPAKRLMMMYVIIIMQMEHSPGGDTLTFPAKFGRDLVFATLFSLAAVLLPYPIFNYKQARETLAILHKLHAAGIGNAMKAFWAPVPIDARIALHQIPFVKIRAVNAKMRMLLMYCIYEPTEFNLNRILRGERVAKLQRVKTHMYAMAAAAQARQTELSSTSNQLRTSSQLQAFEKRVQEPSMLLAKEVMTVLTSVAPHVVPHDVVSKVSYDAMCNRGQIMSDILRREMNSLLFLQTFSRHETNSFLRTYTFIVSLIDIARELRDWETEAKNFDPKKYPSLARRALNFFFLDRWHDFWSELPKRLTLATPRDVRLLKDSIRYCCAFGVACAFTLNYDHTNVYMFGMAILMRLAQQTAAETLQVGVYRICGLCIGTALAYITVNHTHNLAEKTLLTMTWDFIALLFSQHPIYGNGAQYVLVISISGLKLAVDPALMLTRVTDNVFAFISYFVICMVIFPVDPIRCLWNTRTQIFIKLNEIVQSWLVVGSGPLTQSGQECHFVIVEGRAHIAQCQGLIAAYAGWQGKSATEPTMRGGEYPAKAVEQLRHYLSESVALLDTLFNAVSTAHRPRATPPSVISRDILELIHPFLQDIAKITRQYLQSLIDATEHPIEWNMVNSLNTLWKAQLACESMKVVMGNIQRNFFAAFQEMSVEDKSSVNVYHDSSFIQNALRQELSLSHVESTANAELVQRVLAMSMHMATDNLFPQEDLQAVCVTMIVSELLMKTLACLLEPMIELQEYEKSRVVPVVRYF